MPVSRTAWIAAGIALTTAAVACKGESTPPVERSTAAGDAGKRATPAEPPERPSPSFRSFADPGEAVRHILAREPRIIGFGEFHQTIGAAPVQPAIVRFRGLLDVLGERASDLVIETWVEEGNCGEQEEVVSKDVRKVTERPPAIENHLLALLQEAKKRDIQPRLLTMRCRDYEYLTSGKGEVDYEKMLGLIKRKLADATREVWKHRRDGKSRKNTVLIYGGALHNDVYPYGGLEDMSYVADIKSLSPDGYVEVDLYVPEYIAGDKLLSQAPWYPLFERHAGPDRVLLFERGPGSYILILRKNLSPAGAKP